MMKNFKLLYYKIKHSITGCNEDDMTIYENKNLGFCRKCHRFFTINHEGGTNLYD